MYQTLNGESYQDFEFLRYPSVDLTRNSGDFFKKYPFFKNKSKEMDPDYFDGLPEISYQLLSASFSIDTYVPADSALFIFLYGKGISKWLNTKEKYFYQEKFFKNILLVFDNAGIEKKIY